VAHGLELCRRKADICDRQLVAGQRPSTPDWSHGFESGSPSVRVQLMLVQVEAAPFA